MLSRRRYDFWRMRRRLRSFSCLSLAAPSWESATHPVRSAVFEDGALKLMVELPALRAIGQPKLHIANARA